MNDQAENSNKSDGFEEITLANGCFWCTEAIFKRVKGVLSVVPGYSGGFLTDPSYDQVCTGETGHAEAIQIRFDPKIIPLEKLLEIFWYTHDPTTLNRQGNDVGTQYRSAVFYQTPRQKDTATAVKEDIEKKKAYSNPIVIGRDFQLDAELAARLERIAGEGAVTLSAQEPPRLALVG